MIPRTVLLVFIALCLLLLVFPAGAVSIRHIDVTVAGNGDADITADYSLSWTERAVVYPAALPLILASPKKNVELVSLTPENARLNVKNLVKVRQIKDGLSYRTPSVSLADARKQLDKYWFGSMVALDGSAGSLAIRFPDGVVIEQQDLTSVPSFEHVIVGQ